MGFFSKPRTGSLETVVPGRQFVWRVPRMGQQKHDTVMDSDLAQSFQNVEFHFHLIVGRRGDVGFYIHYKRDHIPKYSFFFRAGGKTSATQQPQQMRQHTAHTIPQDTERCGHWNVCSMADVLRFLPHPEETLEIHFTFDADYLVGRPLGEEGAKEFVWVLPTPTQHCLTPFCSASFTFNGVYYVIRLDEQADGNFVVFVFSRTGLVPPHTIEVGCTLGEVRASVPKTEDMTTQLLRVPRDVMTVEKSIVRVVLYRGGNPLDVLNHQPADADLKPVTHTQPAADEEKAKKYGIAMDDI
jgi:hypothetical protein